MKKTIIIIVNLVICLIGIKFMSDQGIKNAVGKIKSEYLSMNNKQLLYKIKNNRIYENDEYMKSGSLLGFSNGYIFFDENGDYRVEIFYNGWCYRKEYDDKKIKSGLGGCSENSYLYKNTDSTQIFIAPKSGNYRLEAWGASGGISAYFTENKLLKDKVGKGAYSAGTISLSKGDILYIQVGGKGESAKVVKDLQRFTNFGYPSSGGKGGYNGGGDGYDDPESNAGGGGGGATDFRISGGAWNNFNSLKSRIMVSGGGGGMSRYYEYKGNPNAGTGASGSGGTISGENGKVQLSTNDYHGYGSTQNNGYSFGIGENGNLCMTTINGLGGGAGGYYGSNSSYCNPNSWIPSTGAGGASSYVSGCTECKSIIKNATKENVKMSDNKTHYSGKKFDDIVMLDGNTEMPNPLNGKTMVGNSGNGIARISYLGQWR